MGGGRGGANGWRGGGAFGGGWGGEVPGLRGGGVERVQGSGVGGGYRPGRRGKQEMLKESACPQR